MKRKAKARKPRPLLGRYIEKTCVDGWAVYCSPLKEPYFLKAEDCRKLAAWLLRAAAYLDSKRGEK